MSHSVIKMEFTLKRCNQCWLSIFFRLLDQILLIDFLKQLGDKANWESTEVKRLKPKLKLDLLFLQANRTMANLISYLLWFLHEGLETLRRPTTTCIICQYPKIISFLKKISCQKLASTHTLVYEKNHVQQKNFADISVISFYWYNMCNK